jgi:hypothetical protein
MLVFKNQFLLTQVNPIESLCREKANDSPYGGCLYFDFARPVSLVNTGLLDIEEQSTITVCIFWVG